MFSFHTDDNGHEIDIEVAEIDGYVHKSWGETAWSMSFTSVCLSSVEPVLLP